VVFDPIYYKYRPVEKHAYTFELRPEKTTEYKKVVYIRAIHLLRRPQRAVPSSFIIHVVDEQGVELKAESTAGRKTYTRKKK